MKIEIEEYKGQTIRYDDEADKFICDITIEDNFGKKKRTSLKDLRREIDLFIKENLNFKPFKVLVVDNYSEEKISEGLVKALRVDGTLVVSVKNYNSWYVSRFNAEDCKRLRKFDPDILLEAKQEEASYDLLTKEHEERKKKIAEKLTKIDLTKYNLK